MKQMNIIRSLSTGTSGKILLICLLFFALTGCRKSEYMPEPEGEAVPVQEVTISLKEALAASPYTLFKAAWSRSDMDSILKKAGNNVPFTLLIPTDAAFTADGLTLDVINKTSPALLDSILLYHTVSGSMNPKDLTERQDNAIGKTLLENVNLRLLPIVSTNSISDKYFYRQYMKVSGTDLLINGKKAGSHTAVLAKDGVIWPVDQVLHKPVKTMLRALQDDGRFDIYLQVMQMSDELWLEASEYSYPRDFSLPLTVDASQYEPYPNMRFTSIFAPTDEAFHLAGFADAAAVMELNNRSPYPHINYDTYVMSGGLFVTDSLLTLHRWGDLFAPTDTLTGAIGRLTSDLFYTNDLNNTLLSNYIIRGNAGVYYPVPPYVMPLEFGKDGNNHVTVKAKQSEHPAATVIEGDINTLMGPIHVVDRLIPPKGFKF